MNYIVDYGSMQDLYGYYDNVIGNCSAGISSVIQKELAIEASTNISGNSADRMRQYLNTTYSCARDMLFMLLKLFLQNYTIYLQAYHQQIDPADDTHIEETELNRLRSQLQDKRRQFQQISLSAENAVAGIADLVSLPSLDFSEADAQFGRILTSLDELDNAVTGLENAHVNADFEGIDALISRLDSFFREMIGLNKDFKTSFTMESFVGLSSVTALIKEAHNVQALFEEQEGDAIVAAREMEKRLEKEQAELRKRQEQAKWAKVGVAVVTTIVSAAVITAVTVSTAGAGLALVPIVTGALSGAVTSTFSAAADEYVKNGWNTEDWDVNRITINGAIGTTTGMVEGLIPPGTGTLAKSGLKAITSGAGDAAGEAYDQLADTGHITDLGSITKEGAVGGAGSFVGSVVGSQVGDLAEDNLVYGTKLGNAFVSNPSKAPHTVATVVIGGTSDIAKGIGKRGSKDLTEQILENPGDSIDLSQTAEKMFDVSEMIQDGLSGGSEAGFEDYSKWRKTDWKNTANTELEHKWIKEAEAGLESEDYTTILSTTEFEEPVHRKMNIPESGGTWAGEPGNSAFYPDDPEVLQAMKAYGKDSVPFENESIDLSPFSKVNTPWGSVDTKIEIGHMTGVRQGKTAEGMPGNFQQAEAELERKIISMDTYKQSGATPEDVRTWIIKNRTERTWHEDPDRKTMMSVPTVINNKIPHTGGVSESNYAQKMSDVSHDYSEYIKGRK